MYSQRIVEERLGFAREELGFQPTYHSVSDVDTFNERMERKYEDVYRQAIAESQGGNNPTQAYRNYLTRALCDPTNPRLTKEEVAWMTNERYVSMADCAYWLSRYFYVKNEKNIIERFSFRDAQKVYFNVVSELEELGSAIEILTAKARQLGLCLAPDTRVLKTDLSWVRLEDIHVGDELVSVDQGETIRERSKKQAAYHKNVASKTPRQKSLFRDPDRKLRICKVEQKRESIRPALRLTMEDGRIIIATPEHKFLWRREGSRGQLLWCRVSNMNVGDTIRTVTGSPWSSSSDHEDGWFGGLLDGEGSGRQKYRGGAELCVAQVAGGVLDRARSYLSSRGYSFREEIDTRKGGEKSKLGNKPVHKLVLNRMAEIFKLIGITKPTRFSNSDWWEGKSLPGRSTGMGWARIVLIEELPKQRMIDLQTSTKTFLAEGLVSHNSTITEGIQTHRICFTYGVNAVVASYDRQKTGLMAQMMFLAYDMMPWWMPPMDTRRVESDQGMLVFGGMRSGVSFQHGMQTSGIARGSTPTSYHVSEVASFPNPQELIEASLFKAVHPSPNVFGVLESTAEGDTGWWVDSYWWAKKNWSKGKSRMCALFLPWFMGTDIYPTPTWIRTHPVPDNWRPEPETMAMMAKAKLYVQSNPVLERVLGANWNLPREQAWWWESQFQEAKGKGTEKLLYQEYPTDDKESFQGSYDNVFGRDTIIEVFSNRKLEPLVYGIIGQSIEDRHEPSADDVDYSKERLAITYRAQSEKRYNWEFVPMGWEESWDSLEGVNDDDGADGKFFIWHPPEPGYDYSIGVDTSNGIGSDASCIAVCRRANSQSEPDIQAAEFRSKTISHVEVFPFVMAIAAYYSKHMATTTRYREPYVSIEQIAAVGDTCQLQMKKLGYSRFHKMVRYDSKKVKKSDSRKLGWYTNSWSRSMLTDGFVIAVQNGWYIVNSPWTIWEMDHWEVHLTASNKSKFEHSSEATDDGIFANAMATFCPNDLESLTKRTKKLKMMFNDGTALPPIDISPYGGPLVNPRGHGTIHNPRRDRDLGKFL